MKKQTRIKQIDKFKQAARDLGADEDEASFNEKLAKIARHKPADEDTESDEKEGS